MNELIQQAGAIAGAISSVLALVTVVLVRPIRSRQKKAEEQQQEQAKFRVELMKKLDAVIDDIGDLQYERLSQSHDFYMDRGWCPASKKDQLCNMHKSYIAKGRNHLTQYYEQELLSLPTEPGATDNKEDNV